MVKRNSSVLAKPRHTNALEPRGWATGLSALVEASRDAFLLFDGNLNLLKANPVGERLLGLSRKGVRASVGKNLLDLMPHIKETGEYDRYLSVVRTGEPFVTEATAAHPKFGDVHLSINAMKVGNGLGLLASDITERKRLEEALEENRQKFSLHLETITDVIYSLDPEFRVISVSPSVESVLGYKPEELIGRYFQHLNVLAPEYLEKAVSDTSRVLAGERISSTEYEFIAKDGARKFGEVSGAPIIAPDGRITGLISVARDVTERKRAEEALEEREENFRALAENSLDAITVFAEEGIPVYANRRAAEVTGYSIAERTDKTFLEFVHPEESEKLMERYKRRIEGKPVPSQYETVIVRKDGKSVPIEVAATRTLWRGKPAVLVMYRDITERKLTEEALRDSEEKLRLMFESVTDGITVTDLEGKIVQLNDAVLGLHGYDSKEEVVGHSAFELIAEKDHARAIENLKRTLEEGYVRNLEYTFLTKNGKEFDAELSAAVLRDASGMPVGFIAITRDITERKRMREKLLRSEEHFRSLIENSSEAIAIVNGEGLVSYESPSFERLLGYKLEDHIGKRPLEYVHRDDRSRVVNALAELMQNPGAIVRDELRVWHKNGSLRNVEVIGQNLLDDPAVGGIVANIRDITERKQAEEELQHLYEQERELRQLLEDEMKRRVEFTRALAHELKTPLTSVLASSDLLVSELRDEALQTLAKGIRQGASNLNSRIDELLDLARGEVGMLQLRLEAVDLSQLLRETADIMTPLALKRGQSLVLALPSPLPPVRADAARLQQVVTNLLSNALKFTPLGGNIRLGARQRGSAVVVEVRDTGRGMSKEEQKGLFEPYHRLDREPSGGLGLGLALCRMLVELHGGQIWVRSNVGRGSIFGFSLPLEVADEQAVESEKPTKVWKVLIIEDDQEIVNFVSVAFEMRWPEAQLISTSLGEEGLEQVETEDPDLVILDLGLPDISGFEVLRQIRLFSSVPVVILTVKGDEADMVKGLEWGADDYVVKPFRQMELLARLKVQLRKQILPGEEAPIVCGSLRLDPSTYQLTCRGKEISLTIVEGRIMQHLMQNAGHVVTHSRLAEAVWGEDHPGAIDSLRVYIRYLREKLEEAPSHPQLILTKVGIGYLLAKPV